MANKSMRFLAMVLVFVMVFQMLPVVAMAVWLESDPKLEILPPSGTEQNAEEILETQGGVQAEPFTPTASGGVNRYTVLLLDTEQAFTMASNGETIYEVATPLETIKLAAKRFVSEVQDANGTNYVAIVSYSDAAVINSSFTTNVDSLNSTINNLRLGGLFANISDAYDKAEDLLSQVNDEKAIKNVILFTQGVPGNGDYRASGRYTEADCSWVKSSNQVHIYEYANGAYAKAASMMERYNLYSIGLFQNFDSVPEAGQSLLDFARRFSSDLQNKGYQEVDDVDDLEFAFGEVADSITSQRGNFKYAGVINENSDTMAEYAYSDDYFRLDSAVYDNSLATMSLCFELSTWSSHDQSRWADKTINVEHLLTGCDTDDCIDDPGLGFTDFVRNDFWNDVPTKDSIGVVAAQKQIDDYTLIAVAVRGGGYGSEWASNFTIGSDGNHDGFALARDNTLSFLREYVADYVVGSNPTETKKLKLWIVGFSRAGAVANMVAGSLNNDDSLSDYTTLAQKDLYCYTFEAPQGVHDRSYAENHSNIHNIINANDLVPLVAPSVWDFSRYGHTVTLPTLETDEAYFGSMLAAMKTELKEMGFDPQEHYPIFEGVELYRLKMDITKIIPGGAPFTWWESVSSESCANILEDGVDLLFDDLIGSRSYYCATMQHTVRELTGALMHYDGKVAGIYDKVISMFEKENLLEIMHPMLSLNPFYSYVERLKDVEQNVAAFLGNALVDVGTLGISLSALVEIIMELLEQVADDLYHHNTDTVDLLTQFIFVLKESKFYAHYPEIALAWLRSQDHNYNLNASTSPSSNISRIMRINCPVDITVYDEKGNWVAAITDDAVDPDSKIRANVNAEGEKVFYLPGNGDYEISISATDTGTVSVSLSEYDYSCGGSTRQINFYDIPVQSGDMLTGVIPSIDQGELNLSSPTGSSAEYQMLDQDAVVIESDETFSGTDQADVKHEITLKVEGNGGAATGAGKFDHGSYAQVEAQELPNGEFLGWYQNEELLSTDLIYRFVVREDQQLVAKFSEVAIYALTNEDTPGGTITSVEGYYTESVTVMISAYSDIGYVFDHWTVSAGSIAESENQNSELIMPASDVTVTAYWSACTDHSFGEWEAVKIPSSTEEGVEEHACLKCRVTERRQIPRLTNPFTDISETQFYYEPVLWAMYRSITTGTTATTFSPAAMCQRAQVATFLWRAEGCPEPMSTDNPFVDIHETDFFYKAVLWAVENGITNGVDTTHFGPYMFCNRAQVVTFLYRTMGEPDTMSRNQPFTDVDRNTFYYDAMIWAVENGVTNGMTATSFNPGGFCNRAQIVTFLYRMYVDTKNYAPDATSMLSGKICTAKDCVTPVAGVSVRVDELNGGSKTWRQQSNEEGNYMFDLPTGRYFITASADGYVDFHAYATVGEQETVYMETFLLVRGEETDTGTVAGRITNAMTGNGVEGVTLDVRSGWNNENGDVITTITTDTYGDYWVTLPIGNYTLYGSKDGYISTMLNVIVREGLSIGENGSIAPIFSNDSLRIVLTWGSTPDDLDAHVVGTLSTGDPFHVYFSNKTQYDGEVQVCSLDVDDISGFGPETITLTTTTADPYYYYVYNFSSVDMAVSGAQVRVYQSKNLLATFNVPANQTDGSYWNVFAIVDGQMVVQNTLTSSEDLTYASAAHRKSTTIPINAGT